MAIFNSKVIDKFNEYANLTGEQVKDNIEDWLRNVYHDTVVNNMTEAEEFFKDLDDAPIVNDDERQQFSIGERYEVEVREYAMSGDTDDFCYSVHVHDLSTREDW